MHEDFVCALFMNRPVRTRMPGGVGRAGQKPALTRLCVWAVMRFCPLDDLGQNMVNGSPGDHETTTALPDGKVEGSFSRLLKRVILIRGLVVHVVRNE